HGMQEGEPQRRLDRGGAELALHAGENRREPDELAIRVEPEDRGDQRIATIRQREALAESLADLVCADVPGRPLQVGRRRLDRLMLRPVLLVAAELAAIMDPVRRVALPFDLVAGEA